MDETELKLFLEENKNDISWMRPEDDMNNIFLHSEKWDETIKIDIRKLPQLTKEEILLILTGGKNVEHVTRVTGFFSKVEHWNKGKLAELKDRYRIDKIF